MSRDGGRPDGGSDRLPNWLGMLVVHPVVRREERILEEIRSPATARPGAACCAATSPTRRDGWAARCRLRPARRGRALRHQQLQFGDGRQVVHRAAQVAHAAGAEHRLLDLQHAARIAAVGVQVDRRQHATVGAADRECHVDRAEQFVPVAHFLRVGRLAEAHQRQLRQHDVVRQGLAQLAVDAPLVGAEHRPRREGPLRRQRLRLRLARGSACSTTRTTSTPAAPSSATIQGSISVMGSALFAPAQRAPETSGCDQDVNPPCHTAATPAAWCQRRGFAAQAASAHCRRRVAAAARPLLHLGRARPSGAVHALRLHLEAGSPARRRRSSTISLHARREVVGRQASARPAIRCRRARPRRRRCVRCAASRCSRSGRG